MKTSRVGLALVAAAILLLVFGVSRPQAFHSGGVAECGGCHSMHAAKSPGGLLLVGTDASSTCLTCHQHAGDTGPSSYHVSTAEADQPPGVAPKQRTPGGDFGWLKKDYSFVVRGSTVSELGETHGHNVVAADASFLADTTNTISPGGGSFAASQLGCQSCHDPHGRARRLSDGSYVNAIYNAGSTNAPIIGSGSYNNSATPAAGQAVGVYRLLRGLGDNSQTGATFTGVAIAVAPSTYNQTEAVNQVRVAYGASAGNTWGNWCGTCHPVMHNGGNLVHPVDEALGPVVAANYNMYVKSGDLTGTNASSFSSLVPFVESTGDIATLKSHASNAGVAASKLGPANSDQVSCLSCHRAHASGFKEMLRFGMENEFMVINGTYTGSVVVGQGRTETEMAAAYYDRPATQFASYQRVLCNKCHAKD